jgi:hypothetical protein
MQANGLAIVGITRFSVISPRTLFAFEKTQCAIDDARRHVHDPRRLSRRFALFRAFPLPSMAEIARRHPLFLYAVLISADLPWRWKFALHWMAYRRPWLRVVTVPQDEHISNVSAKVVTTFAGHRRSFNFRIDDDDALAPSFLDAVLQQSEVSTDDVVLSFGEGFYLQAAGPGALKLQERKYRNSSVGLGLFSSNARIKSIYALGNHRKVHEVRPVVDVADRHYWISTIHSDNDSSKAIPKSEKAIPQDVARARLAPIFPHLDLEQAFAALVD